MISSKERKILMLIALISSAITTAVFYLCTRSNYKNKMEIMVKTVVIDQDYVLATNKEINQGMILQREDLVWLKWPKFCINTNYITTHLNEAAQVIEYASQSKIDNSLLNKKSKNSLPKYCPITIECVEKDPVPISLSEVAIDQGIDLAPGQNINLVYKNTRADNLRVIKIHASTVLVSGDSRELLKINHLERPIVELH